MATSAIWKATATGARLRRRRRAHENAGRRCLQLTVATRAEPRPPTIRRRARKRRDATVRTVRNVRPRNYTIAVQRLAAAGRCCGPSPARYRRNRPHQALEIQCGDRCGRCGRKWHPPFWCSGIAACLNDAADRPWVPANSLPTNLGQRSRAAGSGGLGRSWLGSLIDGPRRREAAV
jgi:hypothetical protein